MPLDTSTTGVGHLAARDQHMHIGEAAAATGLTPRTIRYYEELGLLPAPERTEGDFRLYTARDVRRLSDVARLKELLGLSLAEIKQIVEADEEREQLKSEYRAAGDPKTRLEVLRQTELLTASQIDILDRKMSQMSEMRAELRERLVRCRSQIAEQSEPEAAGLQP